MTCLFNNPAQFMTITLGVSSAGSRTTWPRWPSCGTSRKRWLDPCRRWPGDDRPRRGRRTLPVRQPRSRAFAGPTIRSLPAYLCGINPRQVLTRPHRDHVATPATSVPIE
jgi:hypothetical protein